MIPRDALRWFAFICITAAMAGMTSSANAVSVLASYSFAAVASQSSGDIDPLTTASNVASPIEFTYSSAGNPSNSLVLNGNWKAIGENGPNVSTADFLVFTVAPHPGQQIDFSLLHFELNRSTANATGNYALYADEQPAALGDNFQTKIGGGSIAAVGNWNTAQIDLSSISFLQDVKTPTTFRLYLYGDIGSAAANVDNIILEGTPTAAPTNTLPIGRAGHLSTYAVARPIVPGAPTYDDVVFSSRWIHPRNTSDPDDTYIAIAQFQPTAMVWANSHTASGKGNANYVKSIKSSGLYFGGMFNGSATDTPFVTTRSAGRDQLLNGTLSQEGDVTSQAFRDVTLSHMKFMVDNGADSFQIDDPQLTYGQAVSAGGGYGTSAIAKFATYLNSRGYAGQYGLPSNLTGFDYRTWVQAKPGQQDTTPVRSAFLAFHLEQLQDYYSYIKTEINNYAGRYVPFSVNNTSTNVQSGAPYTYPQIDFWIGETSEQYGKVITNGPKGIYDKVRGAEAVGRRQVFSPPNDSISFGTITTDVQYLRISRQIFAAAYASGSVALIPWDVWRREDPRYFATFQEFGDLTQLVGQNQQLFADHEQVYAVGSGLSPQFSPGLSTEPIKLNGTSNKFLATVRAAPGGVDAVVHLVDWNTTTSAFSIDLQNALFGWPTDMPITARLLSPNVNGTVEQVLSGTLNVVAGYTRFSIPVLNPYALLAIQAIATIPGDFNNDGKVDSGDYVVWRTKNGGTNTLPNDPTPNTVSQSDYALWRANFGKSIAMGIGASTNVPEPTVAPWLVAIATMAYRRKRR